MFGFLNRGRGLLLENHADPDLPVGELPRGSVHGLPDSERVHSALSLCLRGHGQIPITDSKGLVFKGLVTSRHLLGHLEAGDRKKEPLKEGLSGLMDRAVPELRRGSTLSEAVDIFQKTGLEAIPMVNAGVLDGMVRESDITRLLQSRTGVKVSEIMITKPIVAKVSHPVSDVAGMLVRGGYRRLPVLRDRFITGIVGSSDILKYLSGCGNLEALRRDRTEVERAMNRFVVTVEPHQDVSEAAQLMAGKGASLLPVVEGYSVVGVLSQRDILDAM